MRKIALILCVAISLFAEQVKISKNVPVDITFYKNLPVIALFNFDVKSVSPLTRDKDAIKVSPMQKGFVLIPTQSKSTSGVLIIKNDKDENYIVNYKTINKLSEDTTKTIEFTDPLYVIKHTQTAKVEITSSSNMAEIKRLIKNVILAEAGREKHVKGYSKVEVKKEIVAKDFSLMSNIRFVGSKFIVDVWRGINTQNHEISLYEPDFYTKGIIAISLSSNRMLPNEEFSLITIINKSTLKESLLGME